MGSSWHCQAPTESLYWQLLLPSLEASPLLLPELLLTLPRDFGSHNLRLL